MTHEEGRDPEWTVSHTPFSVDLYDAAQTAEGPYAVGGGGTVARKHERSWEALIANGPSGQGSTLKTIAVTDEGQRVWFAGASGALGMYDLRRGEKQDYSYTGDATTSWQEIAVTGPAGEERALLANSSGAVVSFQLEGTEVTFSEPTEPGQGDVVTALTTASDGVGYAVDGAGQAYRATPEGWTTLGTVNAGTELTDVYADSSGRLLVAAADGKLYHYDRPEESWTPIDVATSALRAVDVFQGHVVALASGATLYSRPVNGDLTWHRTQAKTGNTLVSLALGYPDVAVGKSGTVVERPRGKQEKEERSEEPPESPPLDPCRVVTEEMVDRLGSGELLTLVEEFGCTSEFTETVAERFELRHLAERTQHRPLREVPPELRTRIRESETYRLCCACCHERPLEPACKCERTEPKAKSCLVCEHCGHAEFHVCRGECTHRAERECCEPAEHGTRHVKHEHRVEHHAEYGGHDCCGSEQKRHTEHHHDCCAPKPKQEHCECGGAHTGHHEHGGHHGHGEHVEHGHHGCDCGR